jgi:5-(carboxyamino)imidazole ribonucleotide synthase
LIAPTVAVIGTGPLARMLGEPAAALGIPLRLVPYVGGHTDLTTLRLETDGCAVVTFDHERVPAEHLRALEADGIAVRPGPGALARLADRVAREAALEALGIPYARASVDVRRKLSAVVARSPSGQVAAWPVVACTDRARGGSEVVAPAPDLDPDLAVLAEQVAMTVAGELGVVGVLTVGLLETTDGRLLVDDLAPGPRTDGLWTQDGSVTSQFENQLRAVLDLPLGAPEARAPWTVTATIVAGPATARLYDGYPHALARDPRVRVHLYGTQIEPGRSVGHVTAYGGDLEDCLERARHAEAWFAGELGEHSE